MNPEASIVIPVRSGEKVLPRCLKALAEQTLPAESFEIIVVDDGSEDHTAEIAKAAGARVIRQDPSGPAVARNRGAEVARGPILLFTDGDCAPAPNWVETLLAPFKDPKVVGVKGTYCSDQSALTARFVQREYESKYERMAHLSSIDFIDTYSAGFRREAFLAAGGYDPTYETASVEDQEFSFRLHQQKALLLFIPEAKVNHFHVDHWKGYLRKKFKIGFYKALLLFQHPGKIKGDSHTPRSLQLQILFLFGAIGCMIGALFHPLFLGLAGIAFAFYLGSQIPFSWGLLKKRDWPVLLLVPFFITLRTLGLGLGLICGGIYFGLWHRSRTLKESTGIKE